MWFITDEEQRWTANQSSALSSTVHEVESGMSCLWMSADELALIREKEIECSSEKAVTYVNLQNKLPFCVL